MLIEVSTDRHIHGRVSLMERVYALVEASVGRHAARVSRVVVHLGEEGGANLDDVRCAMEVRLAGLGRSGVTHRAGRIEDAISGAATKLRRAVERAVVRPAPAR